MAGNKFYSGIDLDNRGGIHNSPVATLGGDLVPLSQLQGLLENIKNKDPVTVKATGNVNIASAPATIDGVTLVSGDRQYGSALLDLQTDTTQNGWYIWNGTGNAMTRALDGSTATELNNVLIRIAAGTSEGKTYEQSAVLVTLGVDSPVFNLYGAASETLTSMGTLINSGADKNPPVGGDYFAIWNSVGGLMAKLSLTNLGTYFSTLIQTLSNKRIVKRATTEASSATPTINTDNSDYHSVTALAANITSFTTNLTGTPNAGDKLTIAIKDNATFRTIAWGASFADGACRLPERTIVSTLLVVNFEWNTDLVKWVCVSRTGSSSSGTIGDGATQNPVFTHNLGTRAFVHNVYRTADDTDETGNIEMVRTATTATFNVIGTPLTSGELSVVFKAI